MKLLSSTTKEVFLTEEEVQEVYNVLMKRQHTAEAYDVNLPIYNKNGEVISSYILVFPEGTCSNEEEE